MSPGLGRGKGEQLGSTGPWLPSSILEEQSQKSLMQDTLKLVPEPRPCPGSRALWGNG